MEKCVRTNRFGDQVLTEIKGRAEFWFEGLGRDFSHSLNQEIQEEEHIWRQKTLGLLQDEQADMNLVIRRKARNMELRAVTLTVVASAMDLSERIQEWGSS